MDERLQRRLVEAGVDPTHISNPAEAWQQLFELFGLRATLIDRYDIEAAYRGMTPAEFSESDRQSMADEVLTARYPGIELIGSPSGDPVQVVAYDDGWPQVFASWRKRLSSVLGETAIAIEHIGSTALPGLAAKPVVDIQVAVPNVGAEKTYVAAIESLGVPLRSREPDRRYFRPTPGTPRVVQIHVCTAGSDWERIHLLFRDYLREHSSIRSQYAALKLELADRYRNDRLAYNEAKTGFILDAIQAAEEWSEQTGWTVKPNP
ncbi:MAG: GrpB family protein [Acidimicrobiia bacterium]